MENENFNITKEKMIKRCNLFAKILTVLVWVFVISVMFTIIGGALVAILPGEEEIVESFSEVMTHEDVEEEDKMSGVKLVSSVANVILGIVLLELLVKLFKNTVKHQTPFVEENIKCMRRMSIISIISFIISFFGLTIGIGLMSVLSICGMYYIFKYGYYLQLESDETL